MKRILFAVVALMSCNSDLDLSAVCGWDTGMAVELVELQAPKLTIQQEGGAAFTARAMHYHKGQLLFRFPSGWEVVIGKGELQQIERGGWRGVKLRTIEFPSARVGVNFLTCQAIREKIMQGEGR